MTATSEPMTPDQAYRVLGLTRPATEDDVRRAFRRTVQVVHPDLGTGSAEAFRAAGEAREVLLGVGAAGQRSTPPPAPPEPPSTEGPPPGPQEPSGAAQRDAERRAEGGGPWDLGAQADADTGPLFQPVAERVAAPRTWRVDVPLALGGVLGYVLLLGLSLAVSGQALVVTGASAAVLLLVSVVWSALGRVRRLPDGWPRVGSHEPDDESRADP